MNYNNPEDFASSNAISKLESLPAAAREEFIKHSEVFRFEKRDNVLKADNYSEYVYFFTNGLLMSYVQNESKNIVKWIRGAGDFAFAQKSDNSSVVLQRQFTGQIIIALEETNVIRISFEHLKRLQEKYVHVDHVITHHVRMYTMMDRWLQASMYLPPKRKYEFMQSQVGIKLSRVPDIYLASWLGALEELRGSMQ